MVARLGEDGAMPMSRIAGAAAAVVTAIGTALFVSAVLATQGALYPGFVSETGVAGEPHVTAYRAGVYTIAAGLLLLGVALAGRHVLPAVLLVISAVLAGAAGTVSCTAGCPLPPYANPTAQDLLHGGASTVGVGLTGLAILLLALGREPGGVRRLARAFLWPLVPLGIAVTFALAFLGRGWTIGLTERTVLVVILLWTMLTGLSIAAGRYPARHTDALCDDCQYVDGHR
jgi:Protein of unknown function (DUF998)